MASSPRPGARSRWSSRSWSRPSAWSWCECGAWPPNSTYSERHKERAPRRAPFAKIEFRLGGADVIRPGTLLALLDVEAHSLATAQTVKVERGVDATLVKEVLLPIVGGDEPKSAVRNDFFTVPFGIAVLLLSNTEWNASALFEREECRPHARSPEGRATGPYFITPVSWGASVISPRSVAGVSGDRWPV